MLGKLGGLLRGGGTGGAAFAGTAPVVSAAGSARLHKYGNLLSYCNMVFDGSLLQKMHIFLIVPQKTARLAIAEQI